MSNPHQPTPDDISSVLVFDRLLIASLTADLASAKHENERLRAEITKLKGVIKSLWTRVVGTLELEMGGPRPPGVEL